MDLFLLLVSQIFDAFVEISNLFLIILDILVKFSNFTFILEFMLLTRFDWVVAAMNVLSKVILLDWAVAEAVNVLVAVVVAEAVISSSKINSGGVQIWNRERRAGLFN